MGGVSGAPPPAPELTPPTPLPPKGSPVRNIAILVVVAILVVASIVVGVAVMETGDVEEEWETSVTIVVQVYDNYDNEPEGEYPVQLVIHYLDGDDLVGGVGSSSGETITDVRVITNPDGSILWYTTLYEEGSYEVMVYTITNVWGDPVEEVRTFQVGPDYGSHYIVLQLEV